MTMKLEQLAEEIAISSKVLEQFIEDFDLEETQCFDENREVSENFEIFARENSDFLKEYEEDIKQKKSIEEVSLLINRPVEKIEKALKDWNSEVFENGLFKSTVSSFKIDKTMGGNYTFVYNYFGKKSKLEKRDFIGYRDHYFYITNVLEPFLNEQQIKDWGIEKPAGIVLYGPPGSGKIFWANKIAQIIKYNFTEIKKHYLGVSYVDGKKIVFNDFLSQMLNGEKVLLFMDDFDTIMLERSENTDVSAVNEETKDIVLHNIDRFPHEDLLMVGSATSVRQIDEEILAPGRFDVLIPIFPPNATERAELILFSMLKGLSADSLLYKIIKNNQADKLPFWRPIADQMKVFSNTMVIDFTQSLKKRIKREYQKTNSENLVIKESLIYGALRDASAKLTQEYLEQISLFIQDVSINNLDDFLPRLVVLQKELQTYFVTEEPRRSIGFQHQDNSKEETNQSKDAE